MLTACGDSDSGSAAPGGTVPAESYRSSFCVARTSYQALAKTLGARGSAPLNKTDLASDKKSRLALADDLVTASGQIVKGLTDAGVPDVQGGQAGANATAAVYRAVEDAFTAARKDFAAAGVGDRATYLAAVKTLQKALVDGLNSLGTAAGKNLAAIDPAFNAILHCP
jgi:hypothetical protein